MDYMSEYKSKLRTPEQAAAVVRVIETMYESARQGRTVRLD